MGKLIKNQWARLVVMTAAAVQCGAAIEGFFWPKIFWDHFTTALNPGVKPVPILQIINLILGLFTLAFEYPVGIFTKTALHRRIESRLIWIPLTAGTVILLYQGPDSCGWYLIGWMGYFWAYCEGETISPVPWTIPRKPTTTKA